MSTKAKPSIRAEVESILSLPKAQQKVVINKIFDATYRRQIRLQAMGEDRLAYTTIYQLNSLKQYANKKGRFVNNAASLVTSGSPELYNKLYTAIRFNRQMVTSEKGARGAFVESAEKYGRTLEQQALYNRVWKYAYDKGFLDIYHPSDFYSLLEEEDFQYMDFDTLIDEIITKINNKLEASGNKERINPKTGKPFAMPHPDNVSFRREAVPIDKHWHSVMPDDIPQFKISSIKKKKIK